VRGGRSYRAWKILEGGHVFLYSKFVYKLKKINRTLAAWFVADQLKDGIGPLAQAVKRRPSTRAGGEAATLCASQVTARCHAPSQGAGQVEKGVAGSCVGP